MEAEMSPDKIQLAVSTILFLCAAYMLGLRISYYVFVRWLYGYRSTDPFENFIMVFISIIWPLSWTYVIIYKIIKFIIYDLFWVQTGKILSRFD